MRERELKITRIGNSRGVRLPAATIERYRIGDAVIMEERSDGILLRPVRESVRKLSWAETAAEMAATREDWSEWDSALSDGLDDIPWDAPRERRVAEPTPEYSAHKARKGRKQRPA